MKSLSYRQIIPAPIAFLLILGATPMLSSAQEYETKAQVTILLISIRQSQ